MPYIPPMGPDPTTYAAAKGGGVSLGIETAATIRIANPGNPLTSMIAESAGFHVRPGARLIPIKPTPLVASWFAPQPLGIIPPEKFGIPEDWFFGATFEDIEGTLSGRYADLQTLRNNLQREVLLTLALDPEALALFPQDLLFPLIRTVEGNLPVRSPITATERTFISDQLRQEFRRRIRVELGDQSAQIEIERQNPSIISNRFPNGPVNPEIIWPGNLGNAFLDTLAALLPPDP